MSAPDIAGLTYLERLGGGGYADVYLYEQSTPRMKVAVKVLKDGRLSHSEQAQFAAEAETMAQLADHPYIVQVFSTGALADGRPYLVMRYYPPPNLGVRAAQERFSVPDVLRTGIHIASAVETAHRAGILHRDIKPANILVSPYGEPGLTDFGIAGHAADTVDDDDVGLSIPWSPPEMLSGTSNGSVQSDVYSLGATLWHLLVGRSPFETPGGGNDQRALMQRILTRDAPPTGRADVPVSLERLIAQSMSKNPGARPRTALEFAQGLQAVEQEQRFPRTEITVAGVRAPRPATGSAIVEEDRTRMRAPVRAVPDPTARSPFAPAERSAPDAPPTSLRPAVAAPALPAEPPTTARPARPAAPSQPGAGRTRAPAPEAPADATRHRPAAAAPDIQEPDGGRRGLRRPHVLLIGAAVAVAAAVVGIVLSLGPGNGHPTPDPSPTVHATGDLIPPDIAAQAPSVSAHYNAKQKVVVFRWTPVARSASATYAWWPAGNSAALTRTTKREAQVHTSKPSRTCIQVQEIFPDDSHSAASAPVCGTR